MGEKLVVYFSTSYDVTNFNQFTSGLRLLHICNFFIQQKVDKFYFLSDLFEPDWGLESGIGLAFKLHARLKTRTRLRTPTRHPRDPPSPP